ncbi:MAG: hypothetical protein E6G35_03160 [Actinobacteria bacterium]|nr:MAG: hypothetical protein E6G35_03160 [Actinomycetota bacterium]
MVFTVPVKTRRAVLASAVGAGAGLVVSGCWGRGAPAPPKPNPLAPALAGALALVDRYQATVAAYPDLAERLQPLLADHQAHVDALRRAMGTPSPTASPSAGGSAAPGVADDPAAAVVALRAAEQAGQADASTACLAAAAEHAALLGSIAACRATHVEVLT